MKDKYNLRVLNKENLLDILGYNVKDKFELIEIVNIKILTELGLEYGIIYNFDSVFTDKIENLEIDIDNIMEARFFNLDKEIRLVRNENKIIATIFAEKLDTEFVKGEVLIRKRIKYTGQASRLEIKKYIDYDDDNQAYIRYTKPCKLFFKEVKQ